MRPAVILAAISAALMAAMASPAHAAAVVVEQALPGDTAWLLTATALVFLALPGLAFYYGGAVRYKHSISVPLQVGVIAAVVSLLWIMVGYTLAFAETTGGWIGGGSRWMLLQIEAVRFGTTVPESAFSLFQTMLAVLAAALMVGAWAERGRFGWVVVFAGLWSLIVYAPVAHWLWGGGWLALRIGTVDFAGGLVIHTTAGVSALVAALLMGRRKGFPDTADEPQSDYLRLLGIPLLWLGLFGVTGGGLLLGASDETAAALINLQASAATAVLVWHAVDRLRAGHVSANGFASGALVGLVAIAPAAGFVSTGAAIVIGAVAALACRYAAHFIRNSLRIDDTLSVFAINGVGGITGTLLAGLFMAAEWGGTGLPPGQSVAGQLAAQAIGIAAVTVWSVFATGILATAVSLFIPMRVSESDEADGLDAAHQN